MHKIVICTILIALMSGCTTIGQIKKDPMMIKKIIEDNNLSLEHLNDTISDIASKSIKREIITPVVTKFFAGLGLKTNAAGLLATYFIEFCIMDKTQGKPFCILTDKNVFRNMFGHFVLNKTVPLGRL